MTEFRALLRAEARLLFREPISWLAAVALPSAVLLIFGTVFPPGEPDPALGGLRFIDVFVPSLIVISVGTLGIQTLPIRLATYREGGFLRRLSTTPAHPLRLLVAQLVTYLVTALAALGLLLAVARVGFGVELPRDGLGFVIAYAIGTTAMFALGLVLAAVASSSRVATSVAIPTFFGVMFLGGVYVPRAALPDALQRIGAFVPPGVAGLQDAWHGAPPEALPLVAMAIVAIVAGTLAVRLFRWE
jgi:ABC-2 type transport system permease protein